MTEQKNAAEKAAEAKATEAKQEVKANVEKTEGANVSTPDEQAAESAGVAEGDIKGLRADSGLLVQSGHAANIHAWAASDAGKEFAKGEKDRNKQAEAAAKAAHAHLDKDGKSEAVKKYVETVQG